jgi:hypothetical protein
MIIIRKIQVAGIEIIIGILGICPETGKNSYQKIIMIK